MAPNAPPPPSARASCADKVAWLWASPSLPAAALVQNRDLATAAALRGPSQRAKTIAAAAAAERMSASYCTRAGAASRGGLSTLAMLTALTALRIGAACVVLMPPSVPLIAIHRHSLLGSQLAEFHLPIGPVFSSNPANGAAASKCGSPPAHGPSQWPCCAPLQLLIAPTPHRSVAPQTADRWRSHLQPAYHLCPQQMCRHHNTARLPQFSASEALLAPRCQCWQPSGEDPPPALRAALEPPLAVLAHRELAQTPPSIALVCAAIRPWLLRDFSSLAGRWPPAHTASDAAAEAAQCSWPGPGGRCADPHSRLGGLWLEPPFA